MSNYFIDEKRNIINKNNQNEFEVFVDGEKIDGNILPVSDDGNEHTVVCK